MPPPQDEPRRCLVCKMPAPPIGGMQAVQTIWHIAIVGKFDHSYVVCKWCIAAGREARKQREAEQKESA